MSTKLDLIKPYTEQIIQKYLNGMGTSAIAKEYGVNSYFVWHLLKNNGIDVKKKNVVDHLIVDEKVIQLVKEGYSAYQISKDLKVTKDAVRRIIKKLGYSTSHKSTQRQDPLKNYSEEICNLYLQGKSTYEIAKMYNCGGPSILKILQKHNIQTRDVKKYTYRNDFFDSINSEESAYWLGWMYSDGNNTGRSIRIQITDLDILEKLKGIIQYNGPLLVSQPRKPHHLTQYCLSIWDRNFSNRLTELGCPPNKTFKIRFPDETIIPLCLIHHFIRSYFDGDGSVGIFGKRKKPAVQIVGTAHLLEGIIKVVQTGTHYMYRRFPERNKDNWTLQIMSKGEIKRFMDFIYKDATIYLQRKHDKFQQIFAKAGVIT